MHHFYMSQLPPSSLSVSLSLFHLHPPPTTHTHTHTHLNNSTCIEVVWNSNSCVAVLLAGGNVAKLLLKCYLIMLICTATVTVCFYIVAAYTASRIDSVRVQLNQSLYLPTHLCSQSKKRRIRRSR